MHSQMTSNAENVSIWWRHHDNKEQHFGKKQVVSFYIGL